ncbi:MAG: hypothetical protein ACOCG5_08565 [Candidatus Alkaliphilus sp. MAG34]
MMVMWGQANCYAKLILILFWVLPALAIWLTWIAEKGGLMDTKKIDEVATEAAKILRDYPNLKYRQALALAKESLKYGEKYRKKP